MLEVARHVRGKVAGVFARLINQWKQTVRAAGVLAVSLGGATFLALFLSDFVPIDRWLTLALAGIWAWQVLLSASTASFGWLVVRRWLGLTQLSHLEALALALPVGLVGFVVGLYVGGFLGILKPWYAVVLPLGMLASGATTILPALRTAAKGRLGLGPSQVAALVFGAIALGVLYLGLLTPDAVNYDASWNHLVIAQDYAREGRIGVFPGDWVKNVPHLGSIVNTWAFLVPGLPLPALRWMMALHNEFTVLLWTLIGVAAGVRVMSGEPRSVVGWVALFLFPGIFVYDGNLGAAADHFLALFIVPLSLATLLALERLDLRRCALLGILAGGALLTKLHAIYVLAPVSGLLAIRALYLLYTAFRRGEVRAEARRVLPALGTGALIALALLSLHFGKNFYHTGNPFFPLAQGKFGGSPAVPDAQLQMDHLFADWRWHPPAALGERVREAAKLVFTFSFFPHYSFINNLPVFGSLYTLSLALIPFVGRVWRLWVGALVVAGALFVWALTFWVDRNLQMLLPLMAAVTGAVFARAWQLGAAAKLGVIALAAVQLGWGIPLYFSGSDRIFDSVALLKSSYEGGARSKLRQYRKPYVDLGAWLPKDAKLMLHNNHVMLGIDRPVLLDWVGFQGVIDYRAFRSAADLHRRLRELGVTHVAFAPGARTPAYKQEDIIFSLLAQAYERKTKSFGALRVFELGAAPPPPAKELKVLSIDLGKYANGIYPVEMLNVCEEFPPALQRFPAPPEPISGYSEVPGALDRVDAVLITGSPRLPEAARQTLDKEFKRVATYNAYALFLRR